MVDKILIVGEAPGEQEEKQGIPFVGASGDEFLKMLCEAGLVDPSLRQKLKPGRYSLGHMCDDGTIPHIRLTNVCQKRPFKNEISRFFLNKTQAKAAGLAEYLGRYPTAEIHDGIAVLRQEIERTRPTLLIAAGNTALWALTGHTSIMRWRGSTILSRRFDPDGTRYPVVPIIHPAAILRSWKERTVTVFDLSKRAKGVYETGEVPVPGYRFTVRPSYKEALSYLIALTLIANDPDKGELWLSVDLETRHHKYIACVGIAVSSRRAICIPFMCVEDATGYFTEEEEIEIVRALKGLLTHRNVRVIGQNYEYDRQYMLRNWFFKSNLDFDTMTAQHTYQPAMRKALDFLSSLYCEYHVYWKDESKEWLEDMDEDQFWEYCCKDAVATYEVRDSLTLLLKKTNLWDAFCFQMEQHDVVFYMDNRGILMDLKEKDRINNLLTDQILEHEGYFLATVGPRVEASMKAKPWWGSPQQVMTLLYEWFGVPYAYDKHTKKPTSKGDFFPQHITNEPLLKPILLRLEHYRSCRQAHNVCNMRLWDKRIMTFFDIDGPVSFRYASRINSFDEGTNFQNITSGEEE